jgi:hypothetical protein
MIHPLASSLENLFVQKKIKLKKNRESCRMALQRKIEKLNENWL